MVRIRLRRMGGKNQPSFRIVAADKESPRDGRFLEILGFYNPRTEPATIRLKEDRIYEWIGNGAQPSDSAAQIFQTAGLAERYERFKAGEKLEKLMEEAGAAEQARNVSVKTRHEPPVGKPGKKKEEAAKAEPPKAEEAADAESETQAEPKEEPQAEEPEAEEPEAEEPEADEPEAEEPEAEEPEAEEPKADEPEAEEPEAEEPETEEPVKEAAEEKAAPDEEPEAAEAPDSEEAKDDSADQEAGE